MKQAVLFIGHGSPMNILEDNSWTRKWAKIGQSLPRPKGIVMISAHWYTTGTFIQTNPAPEMLYDMYGFPDELYQYVYPAHTTDEIISEVRAVLDPPVKVTGDPKRGYDHGGYSVLSKTHPKADIPLVQLSSDRMQDASFWFSQGQRLSALREKGYLIFGSGNIVHNLRAVNPGLGNQVYDVCKVFDETIAACVKTLAQEDDVKKREKALDTLLHWEKITGADLAAAWPDHLSPFYYALGAVMGPEGAANKISEELEIFCQDYLWGSLSMTSYLWK